LRFRHIFGGFDQIDLTTSNNSSETSGDRSPDAAWSELSRWRSLSAEQRQKFPSIAPDFVIELRSRSDLLAVAKAPFSRSEGTLQHFADLPSSV